MTSSTRITTSSPIPGVGPNTADEDGFGLDLDALQVRVLIADGMTVVSAAGRLVRHTARRLSAVLDSLAPTTEGMIVVDLGEVSLLDTVGLGICMTSAHAARSEGCSVVVLPPAGRAGAHADVAA